MAGKSSSTRHPPKPWGNGDLAPKPGGVNAAFDHRFCWACVSAGPCASESTKFPRICLASVERRSETPVEEKRCHESVTLFCRRPSRDSLSRGIGPAVGERPSESWAISLGRILCRFARFPLLSVLGFLMDRNRSVVIRKKISGYRAHSFRPLVPIGRPPFRERKKYSCSSARLRDSLFAPCRPALGLVLRRPFRSVAPVEFQQAVPGGDHGSLWTNRGYRRVTICDLLFFS